VESHEDMMKRAENCMKDIEKKYSDKTILIVSHNRMQNALVHYLLQETYVP
jgi:broad specificity phosphatase PhoE